MSKIIYMAPVREMHGSLSKQENIVFNTKHYLLDGIECGIGKAEAHRRQKRDYSKTKIKGRELENVLSFGEASHQARLIRSDPEQLAYWKQRFMAQCRKPEPGMKQYVKFDAYLIAMIRLGHASAA